MQLYISNAFQPLGLRFSKCTCSAVMVAGMSAELR